MMNNIAARLNKHYIIRFDTWQYAQFGGEAELSIALLDAITNEVRDKLSSGSQAARGLKDKFSSIKKRLRFNLTLGIPNVFSVQYRNDNESSENEDKAYYDSIKTFHDEFGKAVHELTEASNAKVIIFIDDLDRLHPTRAVELLEIIKIFLDVEGWVFVLSIDYGVVTLGIKAKYGDDLMYQKGKSFFDKMIQLPFQIPVNFYKMNKLLNNTFERMGISINQNSQIAELIEQCVGSNPRMVKRVLNSFELLVDILNIEKSAKQEQQYIYLLFILILQLYDEHLYRYLLRSNKWALPSKDENSIFNAKVKDISDEKYIINELFDGDDKVGTPSIKKTISFIKTMDVLLGKEDISRENNIELFQTLLHQSQVTSFGTAEISHTNIIELTEGTELTNLAIRGLIIDGQKEFVLDTYRDAFIKILETLIDEEKFKAFVNSREKTNKAHLPDRIFSQIDGTSSNNDIKYHVSSIKRVNGVNLVLHYGRKDLNNYLFSFLEAFNIKTKIYLKVVDAE